MEQNDKKMTLGQWIITLVLTIIPVINVILLLVWSFSSTTNVNKKNFAIATLIVHGTLFIISLFPLIIIFTLYTFPQ